MNSAAVAVRVDLLSQLCRKFCVGTETIPSRGELYSIFTLQTCPGSFSAVSRTTSFPVKQNSMIVQHFSRSERFKHSSLRFSGWFQLLHKGFSKPFFFPLGISTFEPLQVQILQCVSSVNRLNDSDQSAERRNFSPVERSCWCRPFRACATKDVRPQHLRRCFLCN